MIHTMKLDAVPFEKIKSGKKTVELRLFDEKRQKIKKYSKKAQQIASQVLYFY